MSLPNPYLLLRRLYRERLPVTQYTGGVIADGQIATEYRTFGVMGMYAVRRALRSPVHLRQALARLAQTGPIAPTLFNRDNPLDFLLGAGKAVSLQDAAYRFCRHEPGVDVVLSGTGSLRHLEENSLSLLRPPLLPEAITQLASLFANVNYFSGD